MRKGWTGMIAAVALVAAGVPAAAQQVRSISASEKAQGAKAHPELVAEYGGPYSGPQAAYAARIAKKVAVQSGLGNAESDFTVTLLNSPVNNAFAIPGGYVYVTRQLMALANDEAELASVLGHEIGHVAARHSASRNRTSVFGQIAAAAAGVLTGSDAIGNVVGQGAQLVTLGFSRGQEYAADDLGIRYIAAAGWDPYASSDMLSSLQMQTDLDAEIAGRSGKGVPTWASTHPNSADRVRRAYGKAAETRIDPGTRPRNRDAYLAAIDGMVYGDDPREGVIEGQTFRHPVLKIAFTAPAGYSIANGSDAVSISGSGGQAQFAGGSYSGALDSYVRQTFAKIAGNAQIDVGEVRPTRVNGLEGATATARANSSAGAVDVTVVAFRMAPATAYHFLTLTPAGQGTGPFGSMVQSFTRLSDAQAAQVRTRRIRIVTVKAGDTPATLGRQMAFPDRQEQRFRVLNGLAEDAVLKAGEKVKLVVFG